MPFGYREVERGWLVVDSAEQRAVARARDLRTEGRSLRQIAEILGEEGFETRTGTAWTMRKVQGLLRAPAPDELEWIGRHLALLRRLVHELRERGPTEIGSLAASVSKTGEQTHEAVRILERRHRVVIEGYGLKANVILVGRGTGRGGK